jgi:hypothetical protein
MSDNSHPSLLIVLCQGHGSRLAVDLESFLQFNAQQDRDLQHLVDRWSDFTTPQAERSSGRRRFRSTKE